MLTALLLLTLVQAQNAIPESDIGEQHAILVSIEHYDPAQHPVVAHAMSQAKELGDLLRERYRFRDIRVISEDEATEDAVTGAIREVARTAGQKDQILVYLCGGSRLEANRAGVQASYFVCKDAGKYKSSSTAGMIGPAEFWRCFEKTAARHVLLIADFCENSSWSHTFQGSVKGFYGLESMESLAADPGDKNTFPLTTEHTRFTYGLVNALKVRADQGRQLGVAELCTDVAEILNGLDDGGPSPAVIGWAGTGSFYFFPSDSNRPAKGSIAERTVSTIRTFLNYAENGFLDIEGDVYGVSQPGRYLSTTPMAGSRETLVDTYPYDNNFYRSVSGTFDASSRAEMDELVASMAEAVKSFGWPMTQDSPPNGTTARYLVAQRPDGKREVRIQANADQDQGTNRFYVYLTLAALDKKLKPFHVSYSELGGDPKDTPGGPKTGGYATFSLDGLPFYSIEFVADETLLGVPTVSESLEYPALPGMSGDLTPLLLGHDAFARSRKVDHQASYVHDIVTARFFRPYLPSEQQLSHVRVIVKASEGTILFEGRMGPGGTVKRESPWK